MNPLTPLLLDQPVPRDRGRAHGEHWREAIHELVELRLGRARRGLEQLSEADMLGGTGPHVRALESELPELAEELHGIAEGADLSPERVLLLNSPFALDDGAPESSTTIYVNGPEGPVLGGTWDLPVDVERYVRMLRIVPADGEGETLCLTVAGRLGGMGIGRHGVAVTTNELCTTGGGEGVVGPALTRAMLEQPDAAAARDLMSRSSRASGRNYMIADGHEYFGVETSAQLAVQTQQGPRAAHLHTNHCFDPVLRKHESVPRASTSFHRLNLVTTLYAQQRPRSVEGLSALLGTRDAGPGSPWVEPDPSAGPTATATAVVLLMRLHEGLVRLAPRGGQPLELVVPCSRARPMKE